MSSLRSTLFSSSRLPWTVPLAVTSLVLATAVAVPRIADADADLPDRSAGQLIVALAESREVPLAGTIVHSADVGIPELPRFSSSGTSPLSLLSGATSLRVWYADETTYRLALYGDLAETDLIRDGNDVWYWNSDQNVVMHQRADELEAATEHKQNPTAGLPTETLAELALLAVEESTVVEVDGTVTVAGRAAYELVARPRDDRSLIGEIRIAVDGDHGVPLRVQVIGTDGGDPAVDIGFTSVAFDEPDRSVFDFTPPPGATLEEFDMSRWFADADDEKFPSDLEAEVVGDGWTSVLVVSGFDLDMLMDHFREMTDGVQEFGDLSGLVDAFIAEMRPTVGPYGTGLALESRLFSALWLDDGRLLVGAVDVDVLEDAAEGRTSTP
ncbi:LolA family protein [Phytoactinopolyspora limicola]|uniref:LolA family protein n=1 Tax=Phytoactinopolyspora limicola TaxID=2715536 RepID=UPI00140C9FF3|nr:outer membrane lipoprotein carrier protein LolA [Phytoactinopolyspora limicola]